MIWQNKKKTFIQNDEKKVKPKKDQRTQKFRRKYKRKKLKNLDKKQISDKKNA